ncbi:methionyl-tRNA formyltransferase [Anaeromyxobacter dehalogenans 2CP-1]|uniref:Methionyl-tRNA formyltransferase n=1 Tax=Anaeromyxobacter dehalogenans (strain ATCC BAA-258 / DSM 21875 / 2CP-1) TaxID=455488 RepID=FMT_ANAD2|nr:methionyl-tRNA formyltransferase [Anaeromyxobacter dehalogenans]B8J9P3.1 RecName: Full=Methionyl-tRNA formyltransferase [Anaeromyxobacter dehalogenans 2CP-1]ACL67431.1 methionyl-tRNA formyltransferase [Anaeromyxobacter dehalogenans 2CP-1]
MRIAFLGTPAFAVAALDALERAGHALVTVVAQPDRPAGRGQALREPATKAWARARGVPVLQPEKVRDGTLAAALRALAPDALVVAAYGRILGKDLLTLAPHGALNVHGSLLPRWRGAAPIQWAVAEGERETGVTIMQMDEGLDTGDVLLQRALEIGEDDTSETLAPRLAALGGEALVEALRLLEAGALVPVRQDAAQATLARILEKEDGRIAWTRPARRISDRLRGFTPWPGAFTTLEGRTLKVLEARPGADVATPAGEPGEAEVVPGRGLAVACGGGSALLVTRVQLEGRPAQSALDLANGLRRKRFRLGT